MSRLFGTDGIRGQAGVAPLDASTVSRVGAALVRALIEQSSRTARLAGLEPGELPRQRILVGGDTRESFGWIERELTRGLTSQGATVTSAGVIPTPAVAYLTQLERFDAGIVVSASHNPYRDNGIKIFSGRGEKLDERAEARIEAIVAETPPIAADEDAPGRSAIDRRDLRGSYVQHLLKILSRVEWLAGSRLVIDCANGATTTVAPDVFQLLGFDSVFIGDRPDGRNINLECGSTHLAALQKAVVEQSARLGVAFDGDGDRALLVDRNGTIVDGDAVLWMAGVQLQREQRLPGSAIVATVMSNIGLELALGKRGIELLRAPVGDKYVMELMASRGAALGGEQSGHIIFADHLSTGDGIGTALQVLRIMEARRSELDALAGELVLFPQVLVNVEVRERADYTRVPGIADSITRVEERLNGQGRVLIRYSGTEPLLRIMLEGRKESEIRQWANEIAEAVKGSLG
jgi:phosphoglucosamine mutase